MFTRIANLPEGAIGFEASGRITDHDEVSVLEPTIREARRGGGKVRLLYVAGADFAGYDGGGMLDEAVFGTRHFADFAKIAFVSPAGPYDRAVHALEGLMPAALRVFPGNEVEAAKTWLAE